MKLYQYGADFYSIQIFKSTLKSWDNIETNSLFHDVLTTLAMFTPN